MKVSKYHGLGNDFIITSYKEGYDYKELAIKYCKEHVGIGADGFIVVKTNPLEMVFYNKDGSLAPMCGNGIRCFSQYVYENKINTNKEFDVLTGAGVMKVQIINDDHNDFRVKINMGSPIFTNDSIKASLSDSYFGKKMIINKREYKIYSLFMGTIHTVILTDDIDQCIKDNIGPYICNHKMFKEKTNVNFVSKISDDEYKIRTYERGVGYTLACGTGACASYVTLKKLGYLNDSVKMSLEYGYLRISGDDEIFMEGPSTFVFDTNLEVK